MSPALGQWPPSAPGLERGHSLWLRLPVVPWVLGKGVNSLGTQVLVGA